MLTLLSNLLSRKTFSSEVFFSHSATESKLSYLLWVCATVKQYLLQYPHNKKAEKDIYFLFFVRSITKPLGMYQSFFKKFLLLYLIFVSRIWNSKQCIKSHLNRYFLYDVYQFIAVLTFFSRNIKLLFIINKHQVKITSM